MLIEEDAFLPESLRFESEPWTFFYRAGEIIRESRKSSASSAFPVPCSMQQDIPKLGGGYTWWVVLFFDRSSGENPAVRVVR